ncbi:MAG: TIGR03667 family PPOX class F420-dependent oxidoreductase [Streptosporangiaceae bacterium]
MGIIATDSGVAARLATAPVAWLTTVRADGQPQSSCIWFHFDGDDLLVFSEPTAAKVRNLAVHPLVSFHLDGDGSGGAVVTIDARAEVMAGDPDSDRVRAYLAKYEETIRTGLNTTPERLRAQFSAAMLITPTRVRSW